MKKNIVRNKKIRAFLSLTVFSTSYISSQFASVIGGSNTYETGKTYNSINIENKKQEKYYAAKADTATGSSTNLQTNTTVPNMEANLLPPSIKRIYTVDYVNRLQDLSNGKMAINAKDIEKIVIEFNDNDVIKKDSKGSSVYAGIGNLPNELIKLEKLNNISKTGTSLDLRGINNYGSNIVSLIDNTESGENDKVIINTSSSMNMEGVIQNSKYKLIIGDITDEVGNKITNPQVLDFSTGPAPMLQFNREESSVKNCGSSVNAEALITDIKTDGSYSGFVLDTGYSDVEDKLTNVSADTVKVYESGSSTPLDVDTYSVKLSGDGKNITVKPNANKLDKNKIYEVIVKGVTDLEGNLIANKDGNISNQYKFYFKTEEPLNVKVAPLNYYVSKSMDGSYAFGGGQTEISSIEIEFNSKDVIKKNNNGSSVYAGTGTLINNLIKLMKVDTTTGEEEQLDLNGTLWGYAHTGNIVTLIDDTELNNTGYNSQKKDKIIINTTPSQYMSGFQKNTKYKLVIGNITDASGTVISNPQSNNFITGPAPLLSLNKEESKVGNSTGSSINVGNLITDIKVDGSYSGFVVDAGYSDTNDKLVNVNTDTVKIYEKESTTPIGSDKYTVSLSADGKKITIKPNANMLQKNKVYTVVVNGVTDIEENPIGNRDGATNNQYRFYFKTEKLVLPPIIVEPPIVVTPEQPTKSVILSVITPTTVVPPNINEIQQAKTINVPDHPVSSSKVWTVDFTKEVDIKDAVASNIIVVDSSGKIVSMKVDVMKGKKSITVTPVGTYKPGETYTLYINKNIDSSEGKNLKTSYKIYFTIEK